MMDVYGKLARDIVLAYEDGVLAERGRILAMLERQIVDVDEEFNDYYKRSLGYVAKDIRAKVHYL